MEEKTGNSQIKKMKTVTTFPAESGGISGGSSTSRLEGSVHDCNTTKSQYHQNDPQCPLLAPLPCTCPLLTW